MNRNPHNSRLVGLALTTALASAALSGCTMGSARADIAANRAETALAKGKPDKAVQAAEQAVLGAPRNAAYRAMLGNAYLSSGRFQSAATSLNDAMSLGDTSSRTALSLSLAYIGAGESQKGVAMLDDWRDSIAKGDLGLAYALAGQPERGIRVLEATLRGGENTPKVRQNLAYSYALANRWREARLMAGQDVPADQVSDRIAEWAEAVDPRSFQFRVASLLNVPSDAADPGQPATLALENFPAAEQLASEAAALHQAAAANSQKAGSEEFAEAFGSGEELPAVAQSPAASQPEVALARYQAPSTSQPQNFEAAFASPAPQGATPAAVIADTVRFVSEPAVQKMPARFGGAPTPKPASRIGAMPVGGGHLVQLGSFYSEQGARRAWGIYAKRHPSLDGHEMKISKAVVGGKTYWRVAATGFAPADARAMCASVRKAGSGCIPYSAKSPLPGAVS